MLVLILIFYLSENTMISFARELSSKTLCTGQNRVVNVLIAAKMEEGFVKVFRFCVYGKCNTFGCNCDGGCRQWISDTTTFTIYGLQCRGECKPFQKFTIGAIPATVGTTVRPNLMSIYTDLNAKIVVDQKDIGIRGAKGRLKDRNNVAAKFNHVHNIEHNYLHVVFFELSITISLNLK